MKVAIIGSRNLKVDNIEAYLPQGTAEIVSGGARGVDSCAAAYAREKGLKLTVFLPDYTLYGRSAPLRRNEEIADYADACIAFWDGESHGTVYTVRLFEKRGKPVRVIRLP